LAIEEVTHKLRQGCIPRKVSFASKEKKRIRLVTIFSKNSSNTGGAGGTDVWGFSKRKIEIQNAV